MKLIKNTSNIELPELKWIIYDSIMIHESFMVKKTRIWDDRLEKLCRERNGNLFNEVHQMLINAALYCTT